MKVEHYFWWRYAHRQDIYWFAIEIKGAVGIDHSRAVSLHSNSGARGGPVLLRQQADIAPSTQTPGPIEVGARLEDDDEDHTNI